MSRPTVNLAPILPTHEDHQMHVAQICEEFASCDPWKRLGISYDRLENGLLRPGPEDEVYFVQKSDQPIGVLKLKSPWLFGVYIQLFGLRSANRQAGIGSEVLNKLDALTRDRGLTNIWLCVSAFNQSARDFYARNDYAEVGALQELLAPNEDEVLMRKRLEPIG